MDANTIKDIIKTIIPNSLLIHRLPKAAANSVLLTFDDGPDEQITPQILDRLEQYNARAVFFVVGERLEKYPHIANLILSKGHLLGNHSYSHPHPNKVSKNEYQSNIIHCQDLIKVRTGQTSKLYRPPMGVISLSGFYITRKVPLKTTLWSIEGGEWGINKKDDTQTIAKKLIKNIRSQDIVLLHDDNIKTIDVLDIILPELKSRNIDLYRGVDSI